MTIRILGAIFIVFGCGCIGAILTYNHRREERMLREIISILDTMECELQYHLTSLPELCRRAADHVSGILKAVLIELAQELDKQISPNAAVCMQAALNKIGDIPRLSYSILGLLGKSLGLYDIAGQVKGIASVRNECTRVLEIHTANQHSKLRCYQTLSLCAGAAIAILLV